MQELLAAGEVDGEQAGELDTSVAAQQHDQPGSADALQTVAGANGQIQDSSAHLNGIAASGAQGGTRPGAAAKEDSELAAMRGAEAAIPLDHAPAAPGFQNKHDVCVQGSDDGADSTGSTVSTRNGGGVADQEAGSEAADRSAQGAEVVADGNQQGDTDEEESGSDAGEGEADGEEAEEPEPPPEIQPYDVPTFGHASFLHDDRYVPRGRGGRTRGGRTGRGRYVLL